MIPTREQIDDHYSVNALAWLRAMRDEIDRLTDANANLTRQVEWEQRAWPMWMEKALGKPLEGRTPSMVQVQLTKRFDAIQADLDRAHTDAALARDANNGEVQLLKSQLQLAIERIERVSVKADSAEHWERVAKKAEAALAKATTPAPEREAAIRAWEEDALRLPDSHEDGPFQRFILELREITAAVALMRRAVDPDAKLRELRAWIIVEEWVAHPIINKIDEMLARPAPVEQPAAAVPDDTRWELVAQLADALTICPCMFKDDSDKFSAIAAKLRKPKS